MIKEAMLYDKLDNSKVRCFLCAHRCEIGLAGFGICGVRKNIDGALNTLVYAEVIAANIDPIEKKPLYHFLPASTSYSLATIGCNFKCGFCQNWQISQSSKRTSALPQKSRLMPEEAVKEAKSAGARSISYTYTEPTIFFEYAYDTAKLAKSRSLKNVFVSNGFITPEALETISPYLDAINIDLKSFSEGFYINVCKGKLAPVLASIRLAKKLDIWLEVTTLIIPGQNDSEQELSSIAEFIAGVGKDIPWHISRFHPDYKFLTQASTSKQVLEKAKKIGESAGLRYVYPGNILEGFDTHCYSCSNVLLKRAYFDLTENNITNGKCSFCGAVVDGVYEA